MNGTAVAGGVAALALLASSGCESTPRATTGHDGSRAAEASSSTGGVGMGAGHASSGASMGDGVLEDGVLGDSCGDGLLAATEDCDDGNAINGDGCSASCEINAGWSCQGREPSECLPSWSVDLVPWVAQLVSLMPSSGSEGFVVPSAQELARFAVVVQEAQANHWAAAAQAAQRVGYRVVILEDSAEPAAPLLGLLPRDWTAATPSGGAGRGSYLLRPSDADRASLILQAPHPLHDLHSAEVAARAFRQLHARGLAIAGTHRCANLAASSCSGSTGVCGGIDQPYRESDMAHTAQSFFQVFHEVSDAHHNHTMLQIHGMASAAHDPIAAISDGTTSDKDDALYLSNRMADELLARTQAAGVTKAVFSCNRAGDPDMLCATNNTQGRLSNSVASNSVCTLSSGGHASGHFLHIELAAELRNAALLPGPQVFIDALGATFH